MEIIKIEVIEVCELKVLNLYFFIKELSIEKPDVLIKGLL